jgi:hypothetical protein
MIHRRFVPISRPRRVGNWCSRIPGTSCNELTEVNDDWVIRFNEQGTDGLINIPWMLEEEAAAPIQWVLRLKTMTELPTEVEDPGPIVRQNTTRRLVKLMTQTRICFQPVKH